MPLPPWKPPGSKMSEISERSHVFCHDMANRITIIGLAAQRIEQIKGDPDKIIKWTTIINEECRKLEKLLRKLMDSGGLEKWISG